MTRPITVGIDGSAASLVAAEWAGSEAVRRHLPLRLLNVWKNPVSNVQFSPNPEGLREWEERKVLEVCERLVGSRPSLIVSAEQAYGTPKSTLLEAADSSETTVLGSRDLGRISGFFYGSVGLHVLAHCHRPVVMVRAKGVPPDQQGGPVVVGVGLGRSCDDLLRFAFQEAAARRTTLRAVHIWDGQRLFGYAAPTIDPSLANDLRAEQSRSLTRLLTSWRAEFPDVPVEERVVEGAAAPRLLEEGQGAGLVVVGRRRNHPPAVVHLGPVVHAVLHHARCPVSVVSHE